MPIQENLNDYLVWHSFGVTGLDILAIVQERSP